MATEPKVASAAAPSSSSQPTSIALYEIAIGHYLSRALCLAVKLGIADQLKDGPRTYGALAGATGMHAPSLNRVMRLLATAGVFTEAENGNFALTPLGDYLRADVPGSMRASIMLFAGEGIQDSWKDLEYCVQTGEPAFRRKSPDADPFSNMGADAKDFDDAMATFAPLTAKAMAAAYDFSKFGTLVDVGGGVGALLIGILQANPNLGGIVFDRPQSAERAKKRIAEAGLESRCEAVGGDFFKEVPSGGDAYLLKHVIHDWNDERATAILKSCHRAMGPQGKLLIAEGVYPPHIDQSADCRRSVSNDVNMLVCTGGRQRSEAEFRALYERAGFMLTRIVPTPARLSLIEGVRA